LTADFVSGTTLEECTINTDSGVQNRNGCCGTMNNPEFCDFEATSMLNARPGDGSGRG
jgi:hypothetical protein